MADVQRGHQPQPRGAAAAVQAIGRGEDGTLHGGLLLLFFLVAQSKKLLTEQHMLRHCSRAHDALLERRLCP